MKKLIVISMVLMSGMLMAAHPNNSNESNNGCFLENKLEKNLKLPKALKKQANSGLVKVDFKVNDNNQLEVLNISGGKKEITAYVKQQLEILGEDICSLQKNVVYHININFKIV